jgi:hypothetical protein
MNAEIPYRSEKILCGFYVDGGRLAACRSSERMLQELEIFDEERTLRFRENESQGNQFLSRFKRSFK